MKRTDFLIVGQGINGSVLALELLRRGKSVAIIDEPALSSSSRIAGGVYNPFNFKFMMNLWRAKEMMECAREIYLYAEQISGKNIHDEKKIFKILAEAERKQWEDAALMRSGLFAGGEIIEEIPEGIFAPYGIGVVGGAGKIDCVKLIEAVHDCAGEAGNFHSEKFDHALLDISNEEVSYDGRISADKIIFCEGHLARKNPLFSFVPFKPAKGQLLHVAIPGLKSEEILIRGVSLLPTGNEHFILSGTFENGMDDEEITVQAEEELIAKAKKFISFPIHVKEHFAGVRPATQDRRAVAGVHPSKKNVAIINGTGSRTVLLAPFLAKVLADNFESGATVPIEVSVNRFLRVV